MVPDIQDSSGSSQGTIGSCSDPLWSPHDLLGSPHDPLEKRAFEEWLQCNSVEKYERYREKNVEAKRKVEEAKRMSNFKWGQDFDRSYEENKKKFWKEVRRVRKGRSRTEETVKDVNGRLLRGVTQPLYESRMNWVHDPAPPASRRPTVDFSDTPVNFSDTPASAIISASPGAPLTPPQPKKEEKKEPSLSQSEFSATLSSPSDPG